MMRYNFRPSLADHSQILILIRPFYTTSDQDFNYVLKKLTQFSHAQIKDCDRTILLKFTKGYSRDTLEWGRLQMHRRPLGFIGVARLSDDPVQQPKDYEKIEQRFDNLISQYENFLFNSRCIVTGPPNPVIKTLRKDMYYLPESLDSIPEDLIGFLSDFIASIFVILESKRVDKISENFDRMILPTSPIEAEQTVTESDTRFLKRKCLGRNKKLLADFCLLSGLYTDALMHYSHSVEHLRSVNDILWMGSALEGICAAWNATMFGNKMIKPNSLPIIIRNSNININVTKDSSDDEKLQNYLQHSVDDIYGKYSECLACYRKFVTGPVELEAHLKFIRVLLHHKKAIEISQIIQSLLVLPLTFNDNEKIEFTMVLATIYDQLNLKRKAAMFRRRTALHYMQNNPTKQSLSMAMNLLKQLAPAYKLSMDSDMQEYNGGWASIQLQVLLDMLSISRRLGNQLDSVRLLCFILERYALQLNKYTYDELVNLLEEFSDDVGGPQSNDDSNETNIRLIRPLPIIRDFHPKRLAHHLQPLKSKNADQTGPFIFSSLSTRSKKEEDIIWVCGDVAEVAMVVDNPLPAEIKVNNMTLITEGTPFEAYPATLALPAQSGSFPFMLLGTPSQPGTLIIKGYRVELLGISNTVFLPKAIVVEVTPALPVLTLTSTLPKAQNLSALDPEDQHYQTLFTSANLYRGHSCSGKVSLENAGKVPVTKLDIKLKKPRDSNVIFDVSAVQSRLPLPPGETLHVDVTIMPEDSWKFFNNQDKIEATLIMSYSCEEGEANGYIRKISWVTYVNVMPSLEFSNYEIVEIERHPSCCLIRFDAVNMTSVSMNVTSEIKIGNENFDSTLFSSCLLKKLFELPSKKKMSLGMHFPRLSLPPPTLKRKTIEDVYQEFISEAVTFSWRLVSFLSPRSDTRRLFKIYESDTNYRGITYLQNMKIAPDQIAALKPRHLNINIMVNDTHLKEGENINVNECKMAEINITLTNAHELDLKDMTLYVNPYQKCYRGREEMKELYLPSGILAKEIKKLAPGEAYEHNCGVLFLYHGQYMVDVSCSIEQRFGSHFSHRQRAYAKVEDSSDQTESSIAPPLSPNSVTKKLKANENDFWAQSFCVTVTQ